MLVIQDQLIGEFVAFNMLIGNVIAPILALVGLCMSSKGGDLGGTAG